MRISSTIGLMSAALLASTALSSQALAQNAPAPRFVQVDTNGVDLVTGKVQFALDEGGIGSGPGAVRMQRIWAQEAGWVDNWSGGLFEKTDGGVTKTYVQIAGISDIFTESGGVFTSENQQGSMLAIVGSNYIYTAADGTKITFQMSNIDATAGVCPGADAGTCQIPTEILQPNGLKFTLVWHAYSTFRRLQSVASSAGYSLAISYAAGDPGSGPPPADWFKRTSVTFTNSANPPSPQPAISYAYPSATVIEVTDPAARTWRLTTDGSGRLTGVRRPGSAADNISYVYGGSGGTISSATRDGVTRTYARVTDPSTTTVKATNALSEQEIITSDLNLGRPTDFSNGLGRVWRFQYDTSGRLTRTTAPEGNYTQLTYDSRGNVTEARNVAKSGSGLSDIVATASFDASCTNVVKCNKPNSTTDARGNTTDYTYDTTHGGILTLTQPAPTAGAVRPQTRYSYTQVTTASGDLVYRLTGTSACQTLSSCTGGTDEAKAILAYNSNLLLTSLSRRNGTGTLIATGTMTYDPRGNLLTVDGPLSGTADTTAYKYDSADQPIGMISPDPDGAGSLKNRAIRLTYRLDGQVSKQELGNTLGQSNSDFSAMTVSQTVDIGFNTNSRPVTSKLSAVGTDYALTQTSYDAAGRVDCTAARMNTAIYGSLPASACTLGTEGSFGPDRIGQIVYDAAGQVTQNKVAVSTSDEAIERTLTYRNNGTLATLKDAENNLTTYEYDGFDRLSKTRFPNTTKGAGTSSTTDYEQLSYDANSNVTSRRLRDANSIGFTLDNLNRVTLKNLPGSEPDVTYAYDNLNRVTSASQTGNALAFTWDALGRRLTETGPQGTATSAYDLANRRTQFTYPGSGLFVNTDYLVTGEVTAIRENGASSGVGVLATYGYDDLGNRTSLTFGNGVVQAFTFDPVSRLASLTNNLSGTTNDLTVSPIAYNPASQIASTVRTGDAYAWTGHGNGSTAFTQNGLNQQITVGGVAATWDTKGNLTSEPQSGKTYGYSSENLLTSATGGVTLGYDPALRLYQVAGAATTRFAYDGLNAIAEYNSANALQRRYVFGPGADEALVQYEGTGTTDRRFMSADERGSIISLTDSSGALLNINRYDEYGKQQSTNIGRLQYTGQMWLSELGAYYYKARVYLPHLGIFAQTDPIGYDGDGPNLYAYVLNDPVNFIDPLGLKTPTPNCAIDICVPPPGPLPSGPTAPPLGFLPGDFTHVILQPGPMNDPTVTCDDPPDCLGGVVITKHAKPTGETRWYLSRGRYILDPLYVKPWFSDYFDYAVGGVVVAPIALIGGVEVAGAGAGAAQALGPSGPVFGDTAFGAVRQGIMNQGRIRLGFGRGGGVANFRLGITNAYKRIFFTRPIPPR